MKKLVTICFLTIAIVAPVWISVGQQRNAGGVGRGAAVAANSADWPTFGGDNARTNANMAPTRITAANVGTMVRQQVTISAPIDAGLIYLRGVQVNGGPHDTFFGTTNLGRTVAIDANDGKVLWEFVLPGFDETGAMNPQRGASNPIGAKQVTNSTPAADANRQFFFTDTATTKISTLSLPDA